jgi:AcrR family transcriptional regulator
MGVAVEVPRQSANRFRDPATADARVSQARRTRIEARRAAALDAGGELLVTRGLVSVTLDAVAARSRISRRVVERWWPSEEALALDVLHHEWVGLANQMLRDSHRWRR